MKQLTRQEVEAVVEKLQEKDECIDPRYCAVCKRRRNTPIGIGNVLFWMQNVSCEHMDNDTFGIYCKNLCLLWEPLIFTRSLQDIISDSGWEDRESCGEHRRPSDPCECMQLTSPEANELFTFLQEIL